MRHRLLILERVLNDIIKEYANGKKERISKITIEVNRDLREMSGKTAKAKAMELGSRIANHHAVADKLEKAFEEEGIKQSITAGLIRKARIAEDLRLALSLFRHPIRTERFNNAPRGQGSHCATFGACFRFPRFFGRHLFGNQ